MADKIKRQDNSPFRRELSLVKWAGELLASDMAAEDAITAMAEKLSSLAGALRWRLLLADEDTGDLVLEKSSEKTGRGRPLRIRPGEGIPGWVANQGLPLAVPDLLSDKRFCSQKKRAGSGLLPVICVPVKSRGRVTGIIEFSGTPSGRPFEGKVLDLISVMAAYIAAAIDRLVHDRKIAEIAVTDDLTKLFNIRYLNRAIDIEISRSMRFHSSVSLIFIDIDYFKKVNDEYGHLVGSKLLVEVGQLLLKHLRNIDIIARYGGDEFVVVLPQTSPDSAARVAERVRRVVEENVFLKSDGYSIMITASFGVASYPEKAATKEELLKLADEAMYRVKNCSRNGVYAIL